MEEIRCVDLGVEDTCSGHLVANSKEELMRALADHLRQVHNIEPTQTLMSYAETEVRSSSR